MEGIHIWSEMNKLADALSRVGESGVTPEGPGSARQALLAREALRLGLF